MLKSIQEVLEYGFAVLNRVYFNNELPPIVITIMSSPKTNGHFSVGKIWRAEEGHYNEINISAEHLDRPIENIIATLCHEMCHFYCQLNGIQDTSKGGRYHNKNFKREAELRGLSIGYHKYIGYSVTTPTDELIQVLKDNSIEKPLDINRDGEIWTSIGVGGSTGNGGATGYSPIIYERALSFSDIWLANQLGLTGWKKTVFIVSLTALVTATASAIGYFIRPYVAKAWAVWSAKLAGLMKGAYSSIAKITS